MQDVPISVEVERSGGFAGIVTRRRADTAELAPHDAAELRALVAGADLAGLEQSLAASAPGATPRPPVGPTGSSTTSRWTTASTCTASPCRTARCRHSCSRS